MKRIRRRTLASEVRIDGGGVFHGGHATVILHPSRTPDGIHFETNGKRIALAVENIAEKESRSCLSDGGADVEVVEHLLACLHAVGITDLSIECPSGEIPFLDGSAKLIWEKITKAGYELIEGEVEQLSPVSAVMVEGEDSILIALPSDKLKISYFLDYDDPGIGSEDVSIQVNEELFGTQIAPARSFIRERRLKKLLEAGSVKSTDASYALIVYDDGIRVSLRVEAELAKHKILDLVGDLYLACRPVKGHFICLRSGHKLNRAMIRKLAGAEKVTG